MREKQNQHPRKEQNAEYGRHITILSAACGGNLSLLSETRQLRAHQLEKKMRAHRTDKTRRENTKKQKENARKQTVTERGFYTP